jgi:hypothetical protein
MTTPTKAEIIERARELYAKYQFVHGSPELAETNPEIEELKEEGFISQAISELMRSKPTSCELAQWKEYSEQTACSQKTSATEQDGSALSKVISDIKEHLGLIIVAESGHGKSFTAFTLTKEAMKDPQMTVLILSPSTVWRRKFGKINCVKVGTPDFNPIVPIRRTSIETVPFLRDTVHVNLDKKWTYLKTAWLEDLLRSKQHLLLEIKYKNGRRIKHFENEVLKVIYDFQEQEIEQNPEYEHRFLIVLEEIQNSFGTYSMNSDDSLDIMTVFTQSRSDANINYIGICQRLADVSTRAVERLRPLIGLTLGENSLRKIRSQIPKHYRRRIQHLPPRHWLYLDGKTNPEITIPEYKKEGEPRMLKPKPPKTETPKPHRAVVLPMRQKAKRSSLRAWLKVFKFLFWYDDPFKKPQIIRKAKPEPEQEELEDGDALTASSDNELNESLFWT